MKIYLIAISLFYLPHSIVAQNSEGSFRLLSRIILGNDTTEFCRINKDLKGYTFVFPSKFDTSFRLNDSVNHLYDTIIETFSSSYGPYVFAKKNGRIMFKDLKRSKKFNDLYLLNFEEFLAPELFSTPPDSYNLLTTRINGNSLVSLGNSSFQCYKYYQIIDGGDTHDLYRVIFVGKDTLLPYRIEYYSDKERTNLIEEIFAVND